MTSFNGVPPYYLQAEKLGAGAAALCACLPVPRPGCQIFSLLPGLLSQNIPSFVIRVLQVLQADLSLNGLVSGLFHMPQQRFSIKAHSALPPGASAKAFLPDTGTGPLSTVGWARRRSQNLPLLSKPYCRLWGHYANSCLEVL